jgi:hypothetical protein
MMRGSGTNFCRSLLSLGIINAVYEALAPVADAAVAGAGDGVDGTAYYAARGHPGPHPPESHVGNGAPHASGAGRRPPEASAQLPGAGAGASSADRGGSASRGSGASGGVFSLSAAGAGMLELGAAPAAMRGVAAVAGPLPLPTRVPMPAWHSLGSQQPVASASGGGVSVWQRWASSPTAGEDNGRRRA